MTSRPAVLALLEEGQLAFLVTLVPVCPAGTTPSSPGVLRAEPMVSYSVRAMLMDAVFVVARMPSHRADPVAARSESWGLYAVAFSFSPRDPISQPAITSVVFSHMAKANEADSRVLHDRALRMLLVGLVVGCGRPLVRRRSVTGLAYGTEFSAANTIFRLLVIEASLGR